MEGFLRNPSRVSTVRSTTGARSVVWCLPGKIPGQTAVGRDMARSQASTDPYMAASLRACNTMPYFATALLAVTAVAEPGLGTMAIDKWGRVYYDPALFGGGPGAGPSKTRKWTIEQASWVLIHEVWHWMRAHHERFEQVILNSPLPALTARLVNGCTDREINDDMSEQKAVWPTDPKPCLPSDYGWPDNLLAEQYWELLQQEVEIVDGGWADDKEDESGDGDGENGSPGSGPGRLPKKIIVKRLRAKGGVDIGQLERECEENSGSGSHGHKQPWEKPGPGEEGHDRKNDPVAIGKAERDQIADEVAREIVDAASRKPGSVPAGVVRWAKGRLRPPQVPWERELAALIRNALTMARGCVDYSYQRPARRGDFGSIIMPGMVRPEPEAHVVIDTSGSMDVDDLHAALSETEGVLKACGQRKVPVICCDAEAAPKQNVHSALEIKLLGGGGTDMGAGIEAAAKDGAKVVIVLTDMGTPWPDRLPRGIQLVVGAIGKSQEQLAGLMETAPPYAKRVVGISTSAANGTEEHAA